MFEVYLKDSNKRARNIKLALIFFTASAELCSRFTSKIGTNEQKKIKLALIFFTASAELCSRFTSKIGTKALFTFVK